MHPDCTLTLESHRQMLGPLELFQEFKPGRWLLGPGSSHRAEGTSKKYRYKTRSPLKARTNAPTHSCPDDPIRVDHPCNVFCKMDHGIILLACLSAQHSSTAQQHSTLHSVSSCHNSSAGLEHTLSLPTTEIMPRLDKTRRYETTVD